tara:strand:+ start:127 stop:312 length:186 start_codon:yes stop_codon:yes gene_type:complete
MGVEESDSLVRHFLKMWRLDLALRVGRGNVPDPEIISEDKDDIGMLVMISMEDAVSDEQRE